jgi:hypothetical protein
MVQVFPLSLELSMMFYKGNFSEIFFEDQTVVEVPMLAQTGKFGKLMEKFQRCGAPVQSKLFSLQGQSEKHTIPTMKTISDKLLKPIFIAVRLKHTEKTMNQVNLASLN